MIKTDRDIDLPTDPAMDGPWKPRELPPEDVLGWVDVAFVIDCTGSMVPYIEEAQARARDTVAKIAAEGDLNLRLALVGYRDHPPQDTDPIPYVFDFSDGATFDARLSTLVAQGGGDHPEAVLDGLVAAGKLQWRAGADKRCFLIGDAPPHGSGEAHDAWSKGCPCGLRPAGVVEMFHHQRIVLHALAIDAYAGPAGSPLAAFTELAEGTGGECEVIDTPERSTHVYHKTMASTADSVGSTRSVVRFATVTATTPSLNPTWVATTSASTGLSETEVVKTVKYMARRGLAPVVEGEVPEEGKE